ncbi:hypothetical protein NC652_040071 [Populus alba x Populus x berolinensis]|nr:hypothetical protein NC652_040071 [Populus alba x Populus x berolinensis]
MFLGRGKPEELPPSILCSAQLQLRWNDSSVGMLSTQLIGRDAISIVAPEGLHCLQREKFDLNLAADNLGDAGGVRRNTAANVLHLILNYP